jgi:hypothetical protein
MQNDFIQWQKELQPFLDMSGYEPKTTFWTDFCIAERFGKEAIKDTYRRAFLEWQHNIEYLTELVMVLNWKCWQYAETNPLIAGLYQDLWEQADNWCGENLKGDDLDYYIRTTD